MSKLRINGFLNRVPTVIDRIEFLYLSSKTTLSSFLVDTCKKIERN